MSNDEQVDRALEDVINEISKIRNIKRCLKRWVKFQPEDDWAQAAIVGYENQFKNLNILKMKLETLFGVSD